MPSENSAYNFTFNYTTDGSGQYGNMQCNTTQGVCNSAVGFSGTTNQITTTGYNYDAAGNLMMAHGQTYQYDAEGRLTGAIVNGVTDMYWYDAVGERSQQTSTHNGQTTYLQTYWNAFGQRAVVYNRMTEDEDLYPPVAGRTYMKFINSRTDYLHVNALGTTAGPDVLSFGRGLAEWQHGRR